MASRSLSCPRCGGSMEQGFIIDETHGTMKMPEVGRRRA